MGGRLLSSIAGKLGGAAVWLLSLLIEKGIAYFKEYLAKRARDKQRVADAKASAKKAKEAHDAESTDSAIDDQLS
jgi:hypothetical protein